MESENIWNNSILPHSEYITQSPQNDYEYELLHSDIFPPKSTMWLVISYIVGVLSIPGNVLTMIVILSSNLLRDKPINIILAHQAFVDITVCLFALIEDTVVQFDIDAGTPVLCHYMLTKQNICTYVSTFNMTILAIERYLAVVNPLSYDMEKVKKRLPYIFLGEWVFTAGAFCFVVASTTTKPGKCLIGSKLIGSFLWDMYSPYEFTLAFALPLAISLFCYGRMFYCLQQSTTKTASKDSKCTNIDKLRLAQLNIFKTCLTVTVVFVLCWCTTEIAVVMFMVGYYTELSNNHYVFGTILIILNSGLNPYIYAVRYEDFKKELKKMFAKN